MRQKLIEQGDPELCYAHFALQRLPYQAWGTGRYLWANDPVEPRERAFIYASIDLRVKEEKRQAAQLS